MISKINISNLGSTGAQINWAINQTATGSLMFGTALPLNATNSTTLTDSTAGTTHSQVLSGLNPNTTYYYIIKATDSTGAAASSKTKSFKTSDTGTVVPAVAPQILFTAPFNTTKDATDIIWVTDKPTDGRLWVSATSPVNTAGAPTASSASLSPFHMLHLNSLTPSTTYYFAVSSTDTTSSLSVSNTGTFTTPAL